MENATINHDYLQTEINDEDTVLAGRIIDANGNVVESI
jgi:hypothetical protein